MNGSRSVYTVLPEHRVWADDGCAIHPHCLTCPLPHCKYDDPQGVRRMLSLTRDAEIARLRRQEGQTIKNLAARYGLSKRAIFRILRKSGGETAMQTAPAGQPQGQQLARQPEAV